MTDIKLKIRDILRQENPTAYIILLGLLLLFTILIAIPRIEQVFFQFDDFAQLPTFSTMGLLEHFLQAPFGQYRPFTSWFLGIQFQVFGWKYPEMFTLISLLLHVGNAVLFFFLLRLAQIRYSIAAFAAACFLFAPCTNETYLWLTCQFDLMCVFLGLLSTLAALAFATVKNPETKVILLLANFVFFLLALFSKEPAIVFPLLGVFVLLNRKKLLDSETRSISILFLTSLVAFSIYLWMRIRTLDLGSTHYGSLPSLYKNAYFLRNILFSLQSLFQLTFIEDTGWHWLVSRTGYIILLIPFILACIRWKKSGALLLALLVCLILISPLAVMPSSAANGRLLYIPNILFLAICALGFNFLFDFFKSRNLHFILSILLSFWITVSIISTREVMVLWNLASQISKTALASYIEQVPKEATHVFVQNLPQNLILSNGRAGPWILKCYAFRHYPVKNLVAANRCLGYPISLLSLESFTPAAPAQLDYFSDYSTALPNEVKIKLDIALGRQEQE